MHNKQLLIDNGSGSNQKYMNVSVQWYELQPGQMENTSFDILEFDPQTQTTGQILGRFRSYQTGDIIPAPASGVFRILPEYYNPSVMGDFDGNPSEEIQKDETGKWGQIIDPTQRVVSFVVSVSKV